MSISSLSSFQNNSYFDQMRQRRAAEKAMMESIQSGDIKGAQGNLATVQAAQPPQDDEAVSASSGAGQNPFRVLMKNDLTAMMAAVQTGDLKQAQTALSKMQADRTSYVNGEAASQGQTTSAFAKDFTTLLGAVGSGDADKAKAGATALEADLQKLLGANSTTTPASTTSTTNTPATQDTLLKDVQDMIAAAQSGDLGAAKTAADQLAKDLSAADAAAPSSAQAHHPHHHHHPHNADAAATATVTTPPQTQTPATDPAGVTTPTVAPV